MEAASATPVASPATHTSEVCLILDAGAQYGKVIDRRVRELSVETQLLPLSTSFDEIKALSHVKAIIISGGPQSVYASDAPKFDPKILDLGLPIFGICYGMQLLAYYTGNKVERKEQREDGQFAIHVETGSLLYKGMESMQQVLLTHGDSVTLTNDSWQTTATSGTICAGIENPSRMLYGVQYHPEVDLSVNGKQILKNFLFNVAGFSGSFTMSDRKHDAIEYIRRTVGDKKVLVLVSGGVDSTVCAALLTEAIGPDRIFAIHIDNGFMRLDESTKVKAALEKTGLKLRVIDASDIFYSGTTTITKGSQSHITKRLDETVDPEEKRKIVGDTFVHVAQREIELLGLKVEDVFLAQGTLRPDLIESASHTVSSSASVIKTHHNDTNLIRQLRAQGRVLEPLADYHKDEVRALGRDLGLPEDLVERQPFPGPGLSIRIICTEKDFKDEDFDATNERLQQTLSDEAFVRKQFMFLRSEEVEHLAHIAKRNDIHGLVVPMQTVGVQGDGRSYKHLCVLSGSDTQSPNWTDLFFLARLIPKVFHCVNRVSYSFGSPIPKDLKASVTPTRCTKDVISALQHADSIANRVLLETNQLARVSQAPIIIFPIGFEKGTTHRSICIRTLITLDFMTGRPAIPCEDIDESVLLMVAKKIVEEVPGIARVVYDLTSKPPGTTEWE